MTLSIVLAVATYTATMILGIIASTTSQSFGKFHHILFFVSWIALVWACIETLSLWLLLPALAMVVLPRTKAGSRSHIAVGATGFIFWMMVAIVEIFLQGNS